MSELQILFQKMQSEKNKNKSLEKQMEALN